MRFIPASLPSLAALCIVLALAGTRVGAATFVKADATTLLGPAFFVDDAVAGGGDVIINQPGTGSYARTWGGVLTSNLGPVELRLTGFGFATSATLTDNDASTLTLSFTYLGADGAAGGGDDVFIGTTTAAYAYDANGEYACVFDAPLVTNLNLSALRFQVTIAPTNAAGDGSVRFKTGTVPLDGITGARFSVAGTVSGALPATARRVNLAKYQVTTASSTSGQYEASFATDGVVGNANSWRSINDTVAHRLEVTFPVPVTVRSAHVYCGIDDGSVIPGFRVQYFSGVSWVDAPGAVVTGNTAPELNVVFTSSVTSDRFRFYRDVDGIVRVKEFALFPPNPAPGTGVEQGFPIGTDVEVNLAAQRPASATAASGTNYAKRAVDGYVSGASKWQTSLVGSNALEIDLRVLTKIGSAHLYSGDGAVPPLTNFVLQYGDGTLWTNFSIGSLSGNTNARFITFSPEPIASWVRLVFTNLSTDAVGELCVFPANGGAGYPLGQDVLGTAPWTNQFDRFSDAYYAVQNRAADLPLSVSNATPLLHVPSLDTNLTHYQVLLNVGTDTYRLRNRVTGKCLAGAGVSTNNGVALVDENYTAMPHQQWRLVPVDATNFYLLNLWSGLAADTQAGGTAAGTPLVQAALDGGASQQWRFARQAHFPKKGMAGFLARHASIKGNWAYNWARTKNAPSLPGNVVFNPMQWGKANWNIGDEQGPLEQFIPDWQREGTSLHLLGFNEPDGADQSDITVAEAITLWPRLERMNVPLASPVAKNPNAAWMIDFMTQAEALGYRMDAIAAHSYPGPNGGYSDALVNLLQNFNNDWNRPVWLTEFSTVDWSSTGTWTEEDNYNWLAEFMWRAESLPWLSHYSLFIFTADATFPTPVNPWDHVGPRSNAYQTDGTTPTAFGELYFAWDGDATVREDKAYFIHNKAERKRLQNAVSSTGPSELWIRDGSSAAQWALRPSGASGQYYITSLRDGRRLRYTGSVINFAPAHTTGPAVQWSLVEDEHGWFFIENPAAATANRRLRDLGGAFSMVSNTSTGTNVQWRFIVPYTPLETAPPNTPANLNVTSGDAQAVLAWDATPNPDLSFYSVYRSTTSGGPYTLIASNLTTPDFTDTTALNGWTYYYVVTATDLIGNETAYSNESTAAPLAVLPPMALTMFRTNGEFGVAWPPSHLGWLLQTQTNSLATNNWNTVPSSAGTNWMTWPKPALNQGIFFRLRHPYP